MKRSVLVAIALPLLVFLAACTRDPKEVAKRYVATGNKYFDRGQYKEASIMYRRALQKNMRDGQAHYHLGLVEMRLGMLGEAQRSLLRANDIDPKNMDVLANLGDVEMTIYQVDPVTYKSFLDDAVETSKKMAKNDPKSFAGYRLNGYIALAKKDVPGAIQNFQAANQAKPDEPDVVEALVRALYANKQPELAERTAKDLIAKHKDFGPIYDILYMAYASTNRIADAEQILKEKVANNPTNGSYMSQLAFHYFLARRPDDMNATLQKLTSDPKKIPQCYLLAGDLLMKIGATDRALQQYQQGEKVDPKEKLVYGKRQAEALVRLGRTNEAEKIVAELLKSNPKDTETVAMHASMLLQSKDPKQVQKAIDELQPLVASTPSTQRSALLMLHFNLARAYLAKGDSSSLDQARLQLQEALKINKEYVPAQLMLADLELTRGDSTQAVQTADAVIARIPNSLPAHLIRTRGLMAMGEMDQSRQEIEAILRASPTSNDARYQLAVLNFAERKYQDAEDNFELLSKMNDPRAFMGIVNCKAQLGQIDSAISMVQDRLRQTPDQSKLHALLVELNVHAKHYDEAIRELQGMIAKDPSTLNYVRLGQIQEFAGQKDAAVATYAKAAQLRPGDPKPILALGVLYDGMGRPEEAQRAYEQVLKLQPDNPVALNNLAYSKADQGIDLDQALTYAERARQKLPDDPNVADTIGLIYLRKNLVEDSVRVLSDLVNRAPNNATYRLHYATALFQKGDKAEARRELDAATRNGPSEKEKLQIQQLRQKLS